MGKILRCVIVLQITLFLLFNTACSLNKEKDKILPSQPSNSIAATHNAQTNSKGSEVDSLAAVFKTAVNDDIWYKGESSWFKILEGQAATVEYFRNTKAPNDLFCLISNPMKVSNESKFIAISLWSEGKGYVNEVTKYNSDTSIDRLRNSMETNGYTAIKKEEYKIDRAKKPEYPSSTPEKDKVVNNIEATLFNCIKESTVFGKGAYKVFVRNFRNNDISTKAVVEDKQGKSWMVDVILGSEAKVGIGKIFNSDDTDLLKYYTNQVKKMPLLEKDIDTSKQSATQLSNNLDKQAYINDFHPIVFVPISKGDVPKNAFVLGGSKNNKWYKISDFKLPSDTDGMKNIDIDLVKGSEEYKFYSPQKLLNSFVGGKPLFYISQSSGNSILQVNVDSLNVDENYIVGVNGNWNALPRLPKEIEKGVYSVDLDNDGKEEILRISQSPSTDKNYTNAKDVKFSVETYGKSIQVGQDIIDGTYVSDYKVFTLDLNGDGKLEIITASVGHNLSITVKNFESGRISELFRFYIGD